MTIDRNEFFREAALRICGELEIEKAMFSTLKYLRQTMPVSWMALEHYDSSLISMRTIATANLKGGKGVDLLTPLSADSKQQAIEKYNEKSSKVYLFENAETEKLAQEMLDFHEIKAKSLIVLILGTGGQRLGTLVLASSGDDLFSQEHADLISLLSEPFAIAMSNTLKHRNELKLFDRDFFWEVTMRICGNLEIEEGLRRCFEYISQHIPADSLYIERYESSLGSNRIIARANADKAEALDILIPIPKQSRKVVDEKIQELKGSASPPVIVYNEPDMIREYILDQLGEPTSSAMGLPLILEDQVAGSLTILAEGNNRFKEHHEKLFATLRLPFFVAISNALKHKEILTLKNLLVDDNQYLQQELKNKAGENIIGSNFGLKGVMEMARQVADLDSPIMLLGETGTGKDLIANSIHYSSSRRDGPFISVNCGAIPESLIDSELFGHEKGAFTGALSQKRGRFERAHGGTIFLDEVGELPLQAQVRLLRVLQNKEIERVGGTKTISLDIRVITATNRDLEKMVNEKLFREDLWFRLNVFPIVLPPLRERKSDIPALVQHFILLKTGELKLPAVPELEPGSIEILMEYPWPGNVRELENVVERALILNRSGAVCFKHLRQTGKGEAVSFNADTDISQTLDEMISRHIRQTISMTNGKIHGPGGAAELLGINASTLRARMNKLGINYGKDSKREKHFNRNEPGNC